MADTTLIPDYIKTRVSTDYGITIADSLVYSSLGIARDYTGQQLIDVEDAVITEYFYKATSTYRITLQDRYVRSIYAVEINGTAKTSDWISDLVIENDGVIYNEDGFATGNYKIQYYAGLENSQASVSTPYIENLVRALSLISVALYKDSQQQANIITAEGEMDIQAKRCREQAYQILDYYRGLGVY